MSRLSPLELLTYLRLRHPGKAPRKQLATKAARKTAAVSVPLVLPNGPAELTL
jgi:hypothetical protein